MFFFFQTLTCNMLKSDALQYYRTLALQQMSVFTCALQYYRTLAIQQMSVCIYMRSPVLPYTCPTADVCLCLHALSSTTVHLPYSRCLSVFTCALQYYRTLALQQMSVCVYMREIRTAHSALTFSPL
jgi:hypothetical protein